MPQPALIAPADFGAPKARCETAGLLALADALGKIEEGPSVAAALRGAYISSEIETSLWFED